MTEQEIRALLAVAMADDNRKPGDAAVQSWLDHAERGGWTFATAREAIRHHFATSTEYLTVAHINRILDDVRKRIREQIPGDVAPPRELRDDPVAEIAWRRSWLDGHVQRAMEAWAAGEPLPAVEQPELEARERPALAAAVRHLVSGMTVPQEPLVSRPARPARPRVRDALHRARLAAARAELNRIRGGSDDVA